MTLKVRRGDARGEDLTRQFEGFYCVLDFALVEMFPGICDNLVQDRDRNPDLIIRELERQARLCWRGPSPDVNQCIMGEGIFSFLFFFRHV